MLIGRGPERQQIDRLLSAARLGQSGVLLLVGEPGVGKTALLDDAAERATGMQILRAVGAESERTVPFGGLLQLLRPALPLLPGIPGPQADALSVALALRPGPPGDRFAIGAATLSLLCRYAEAGPVALLVDDLHLLDRPSAQAIAFAARRLMADPILLLAGARSAELTEVELGLPSLEVTGLDEPSSRLLLAAQTDAPVTEAGVASLQRATAGNPLALLELAADRHGLERLAPDAPVPVSTTLAATFAARAGALPPSARDPLLVAAVAGGDLRVIAAACDLLGLDPAGLDAAESVHLIRIDGERVEFRHPLVRASVYAEATGERRRTVHRAVAEALPADADDRRAWHLAESVIGPDDDVAALLEAAGLRARDRSAPATAALAFETAARLSAHPGSRARRFVSAAELASLAGSSARAAALLAQAEATPDHADVYLRTLRLRAAFAARSGSLAEARDLLVDAAAQATDPDTTALLLADAVISCLYLADVRSARSLAERLEATDGEGLSAETRAVAATAAGVGRILAGEAGAAQIDAATRVLAAAEELRSDERRSTWLMIGPLFLREVGRGDDLWRAVDEVRRRAAVGALPAMLFHVGRDEATTDRWSRAEATYVEGIRLARETGQSTDQAMSQAGLAWLLARQGRTAECRDIVAEAMPLCRTRDIRLGQAWLLFAEGDLALAAGDAGRAAQHYAELEALLEQLHFADPDLSPAPELTEALLRLGRDEQARRTAVEFAVRAERKGQPWALARAERALGLTAPPDALDEPFRAALDAHARTADGYETARTALAYGERLRRVRRRDEARVQLRAAMTAFAELPAPPWAERAAVELEATGEVVRRRTQSPAAQLTPQELQITLLLVEGRTTREVAAALFLSPKTVEYHLRKVYLKLGVSSRTALAEAMGAPSPPDQ